MNSNSDMIPKQKNPRGFTLIEVIVALFFVTTGIIGSYLLIVLTISSTNKASNKFTAAYLAQEGIELVRNIRDTNWLESPAVSHPWDEGLRNASGTSYCNGDCAGNLGGCILDYTSSQNASFDFSSDPVYQFNDQYLSIGAAGLYGYSPVTPTKFQRQINITNSSDPNCPTLNCFEVCVWVGWTEKGVDQRITVRENLYNWR